MRLAYYAGASTFAAAACLLKAFSQRPNFYSATVYLSQSNACLLILTNLLLLLSTSFLYLLQRLLFGPLRPIEIEQLSEKAWYAVLDTLLAMPSFREDVGGRLLVMFVLLLAGKVWGWLGEGRVDILEQGQMMGTGANNKLFHVRLATSLLVSVAFAVGMFKYCVEVVIEDPRPGMMVIFTFEFAILCVFSMFTAVRYGLAVWEIQVVKQQTVAAIEQRKAEIKAEREAAIAAARQEEREIPTFDDPIEVDENEVDVPGWEDKRRMLFVVEVFTDFIKLMIYIFFFTVSVTFNGLPMHIMRDVYMTFASFSKRVTDYMAYRKATSDMNTRYPDATTEEIRGDACIVCREDMVAWADGEPQAAAPAPPAAADGQPAAPAAPVPAPAPAPARRRDEGLRAKKLPCGHILHLRCLKAWLERQQVCPTCRRPVVTATAATATGGNAAAPGQNGQNGQPGQAQAPRPRGRIFNLGPLRIGMVNAPRGQLQNVLNQIRDGNPPGVQQALDPAGNAGAGGDGQQPHTGTVTRPTGMRSQVPVQVQLMQLEQRIIQDMHNLNVGQQQLTTLRMMEAEVARLRAYYHPPQANPAVRYPMPGFAPQHQPFAPPPPQHLQGNPTQQLGSGHEHLPPGMTLPEGWTVMPLQPVGGQTQHGIRLPGPALNSNIPANPGPSIQPQVPVPMASATATSQSSAATAPDAPQQAPVDPRGPTDESGSPLFVPVAQDTTTASAPTQPDASAMRAAEERGEAAGRRWAEAFGSSYEVPASVSSPAPGQRLATNDTASVESQLSGREQPASAAQAQTRPPWTDGGWSFGDQSQTPASAHTADGQASEATPTVQEPTSDQNGSYSGKGKAKAVEVEDVPDPES
ncbi:Putative Zinc finger, RING-type [Septoria linicola]|uniref:RING-type E3 ubiquitin transferase n=1 Tax=Septoria linicola TaxID=215465 RepID=A0A9Q9B8E4_9PEZI|nr:putative Zinc finger, RING-type [Septoria linicola]USW59293.1 Putative Zinc finger, RING-type [Septoria linicola]